MATPTPSEDEQARKAETNFKKWVNEVLDERAVKADEAAKKAQEEADKAEADKPKPFSLFSSLFGE